MKKTAYIHRFAPWNARHLRAGGARAAGFTIIELLIATSIFSVVLLVALTGFFQIGKIYYKGISSSQTQGITQKIIEDMSTNLQFAVSAGQPKPSPGATNRFYMCIGSTRYTYVLNNPANASENPTNFGTNNFGLLRDSGGCGDPFSALDNTPLKNATEILAPKMRISKVCIKSLTGGAVDTTGSNCAVGSCTPNPPTNPCYVDGQLYLINLIVAYGDSDVLDLSDPQDPSCNANVSNSQYCSVANLQTVISRGYGN